MMRRSVTQRILDRLPRITVTILNDCRYSLRASSRLKLTFFLQPTYGWLVGLSISMKQAYRSANGCHFHLYGGFDRATCLVKAPQAELPNVRSALAIHGKEMWTDYGSAMKVHTHIADDIHLRRRYERTIVTMTTSDNTKADLRVPGESRCNRREQ